jgi:hypothetical protein
MNAETNKRPEPIVLIARAGKGCRQYTFNTFDELQAFCDRKPYSGEHLLVMPMHARQFLAEKMWMPARDVTAYVRELVTEAREAEATAARLATILLEQADRESEQCAFWFISALSKLASTQPHLRLPDVLRFAREAMPVSAAAYASYAADKC